MSQNLQKLSLFNKHVQHQKKYNERNVCFLCIVALCLFPISLLGKVLQWLFQIDFFSFGRQKKVVPGCVRQQSSPFDICDCRHTCRHMRHQFDVCKKQHVSLLFMTLNVWDIGTKRIYKQKHQIPLIFVNFSLA